VSVIPANKLSLQAWAPTEFCQWGQRQYFADPGQQGCQVRFVKIPGILATVPDLSCVLFVSGTGKTERQ